ncbi:MAG: hypothetical protein EOO15_03305 [Chitinophagaceae bacterium]|nr:MAG: hypothetical protein EOO15_03305 [Chitinophagaceae bacterium]
MKHLYLLLLPILLLGACSREPKDCRKIERIYTPYFKTRAEVRSAMNSSSPRPIERPGKLYSYGSWIFLSDKEQGIHVIDNQNPGAPVQRAYLPIPGNIDIAVKGHHLYADSWADLVVFDLSDMNNIRPVKFLSDVFPHRASYWINGSSSTDSTPVVAGYTVRDTMVECISQTRGGIGWGSVLTNAASSSGGGAAGSMSRFALTSGRLYTVDGNALQSYTLNDPANPQPSPPTWLNASAETLYPFGSSLFIGTTTGMYIYDISTPSQPTYLSHFEHARLCDPVITDGTHAFVTLRSGGFCAGNQNQLDVLRVTNLLQPVPVRTYELTNPHGLAKDGDLLFVCDGDDGLKVYNCQDPANLVLLEKISVPGTFDVIAQYGQLYLVSSAGLYQYNYNTGLPYRSLQLKSILSVRP